MKGIYILIFQLPSEKHIQVGKLGRLFFKSGYYAYIGSALSGIQRVNRHINNMKKGKVENPHWHIDYIIHQAKIIKWIFAPCSSGKKEEELASAIAKDLSYINGFGSSDTSAPSHLFFSRNLQRLKNEIKKKCDLVDLNSIHGKV